ncbi:hypothetical protein RSAG8_09444, partial [Rhizoctonia solani AG-8 WAC10335]
MYLTRQTPISCCFSNNPGAHQTQEILALTFKKD